MDSSSNTSDILILGAGIIGLSSALQLLEAGYHVRLLDRGRAGAATSAGNCGTITPSHAPPLNAPGTVGQALRWLGRADAPLYIKPTLNPARLNWFWHFARRCRNAVQDSTTQARSQILQSSRDLLEALVRDHKLDCEFTPQGTLYVWRDPEEFEHAQALADTLNPLGLTAQLIDAATLMQMEPALKPGAVGGLHHQRDAQLRPERYAAELARRVREMGGEIHEETNILGVSSERGKISGVETSRGRFQAREYLLALGAWSPLLGRQLGLKIPIQPGKGYSITFNRPGVCPRLPLVLKERSVCVTAWESGFRLGSTMEFSGYDESLNRQRLDALIRASREYLQEAHGPHEEQQWYGWRPMTWDELPIIGRSPQYANLSLATGHGMLGVTMSAATGLLIRNLIHGEAPHIDPHPYRPERFLEAGYG